MLWGKASRWFESNHFFHLSVDLLKTDLTIDNMTNSEYKLMECLEQAHDSLVAAAKIAHIDKQPEAAVISSQIDTLEDIISEAWERFRSEEK